jgi:hypothetical protein
MNTRLALFTALLLASSATAAFAQGNQPIISVSMTEVDDLTAHVSYGVNPFYGQTYPGNPLSSPHLNGGSGLYSDTVEMWALATGTFPEGGYTYTFYVNGEQIGNAILNPAGGASNGIPQSIGWTPPQPGVYYLSCNATDGLGHSATSLAIEYFATGISIVSPLPHSYVPLGSSVVIQAAAAISPGAISRVDFWVDGGPHSGGTFLGSVVNYPYSVIYTPDAPNGFPPNPVHWIDAISYAADGSLAFQSNQIDITVVQPVTPLPVCVISSPTGTPAVPSTIPIPDYASSAQAFIPIVVNASGALNITHVELYINGVLFNTLAAFPYVFQWQPTVTGIYNLTALAYDGKNNVIASTTSSSPTLTPAPTTVIIGALPTVAITAPGNGATLNGGGTAVMTATATDTNRDALGNPIAITQVQFFQDGNFVGVATQPTSPGGDSYTVTFTAKQNIDPTTGLPIPSQLTAIATDALGFTGNSPSVEVSVTSGGSGGGTIIGIPPTVSIVNPTPQESVVVNTPVTLSATGTAPNGNIQQIEFLVDNNVLSTATKYPYSVTWQPANLGTYTITAQVTDNVGDKVNSTAITVYVVPEPPPVVSIAAPSSGGIVVAGSGTTVTASATSPSGTIAQVQFYANGLSIGTATALPYSVSWTPVSTGVYTLTAIATDNSGETTTSAASIVEAVANSGGLGNSVYFGQYQGLTDGGRFAFATIDGKYGAFIGHSSANYKASSVLYPDLSVGSGGGFSSASISGSASATGVTGILSASHDQIIGTITQSGSVPVAAGYYTGSISGQAGSAVTAIVGYDGEVMVYVSQGSFADAGDSTVDSSGAFSLVTSLNNTIAGTVDPTTGFLSATLTGGPGGLILAGRVSGGTFSDGVLKNISTRGMVGTGAQNMIAGFVVGGTVPKNLLVRAVGPTLSTLGVPGAVAATQLAVYTGTTLVASNTGWSSDPSNEAAVVAAEASAGAYPLPVGSADSALVGTFAPGAYTALVSGVGSDTGIGLVEVFDLDQLQLFSSQKLVNVSTRGNVGTGADIMIGGIIINGSAPKRLLIRGAGPALSTLGVSGALATPRLQLFNGAGQIIRENYSWQVGNDAGLVSAAEAQTGAFAFGNGSADSAILIVLPPGSYTAELSGAGQSTGTALVEVYEVP